MESFLCSEKTFSKRVKTKYRLFDTTLNKFFHSDKEDHKLNKK